LHDPRPTMPTDSLVRTLLTHYPPLAVLRRCCAFASGDSASDVLVSPIGLPLSFVALAGASRHDFVSLQFSSITRRVYYLNFIPGLLVAKRRVDAFSAPLVSLGLVSPPRSRPSVTPFSSRISLWEAPFLLPRLVGYCGAFFQGPLSHLPRAFL